ncbi:MAG: triose-phosphate isomerase [Coprothermobacterota bacterium]|nr:triose-phosphate isomerase [Coprothermobacterota bacterium]
MRRKIIAGNWKCNKTRAEAISLLESLLLAPPPPSGRQMVAIPPFPYLEAACTLTAGSHLSIGAQNLWTSDWGAYTGEVSAPMLASLGVRYVVVGHSERRQRFGEDGLILKEKVERALAWGLTPIFCLGERLEERDRGQAFEVVADQLKKGLGGLSAEQLHHLVIAYEPVWAIGTGRNATPEQAQEVHSLLRGLLTAGWGESVAQSLPILYGGSVKPDNVDALMAMPDLDGALVGGASLKADDFLRIAGYREG